MISPDTRPFHFQQFSMFHHRSTMKVGTDAVLLAIWTDLHGTEDVLDVGTGCGIIPLLLAARNATIKADAVELDLASFEEAAENFANSPFAKRLQAYHTDVNRFDPPAGKKYDLIISNPPFFINDYRPKQKKRQFTRHADSLSYSQLVNVAMRLMKPNGRFALVLPYKESKVFLQLALKSGLYLQGQMLIFPKPCKEPNRINLLLGLSASSEKTEKLIIRNEKGNFTKEYMNMVKNYYLSP